MQLDASDHEFLVGRAVSGRVSGYNDATGALRILLSKPVDPHVRLLTEDVDFVVTTPVLRWHGHGRLLLMWVAVRIVSAPSFRDDEGLRSAIATGRLVLR
jgi:hypothetical protein